MGAPFFLLALLQMQTSEFVKLLLSVKSKSYLQIVEDVPDLFIIIFYIFNNVFKYDLTQISEIGEMFKYVFLLNNYLFCLDIRQEFQIN